MAVTIQSIVAIDPVTSRAYTTERDDTGIATATMTITGYTDRDRANLDAAEEIARQLNELAANYHYRIVHIADSEDSQYDGLYALLGATVTATPATSNSRAALFAVSVTLRRVGGGGVSGDNTSHYVAAKATLVANAYSVTALTYLPVPVGATFIPTATVSGATRTGEDGAMNLAASAALQAYVFAGADQDAGECKVWDTGGSATPADWVRVYSPDHPFAATNHCVIDNSLVRFRPHASSPGRHEIDVWNTNTSAWTAITSTDGDLVTLTTVVGMSVQHLSPWLVIVTWFGTFGSATIQKTLTLERGKHTAKVRLSASASVALNIGLRHDSLWRWLWARDIATAAPAIDMSIQSTTTLGRVDDFAVLFVNGTYVVGIVAVATASPTVARSGSAQRGVSISQTTTALECYLGGVAYDPTDAWAEAESETLLLGATAVSTIASASGGGNNQVQLNALNEQVSFTTLQQINSSAPGTFAFAIFRVASTVASGAANAGDVLTLGIWNQTAGSAATSSTATATNATFFTTANTWVWIGIQYATWNGTDALYPYALKSANATAQAFHIDQCLFFSINGGAGVNRPRDVGHQALTDVAAWSSVQRSI